VPRDPRILDGAQRDAVRRRTLLGQGNGKCPHPNCVGLARREEQLPGRLHGRGVPENWEIGGFVRQLGQEGR
jgi:hypothetical protein